MTDLDPEIWENKTLGAAAPNENLDRLTKQQQEDRAAKFENREPREVVIDNNYPDWTPPVSERTGTVPSNFQTVHFADEQPADIPVDSGRPEEDAGTVAEEQGEEDIDQVNGPEVNEEPEEPVVVENEPGTAIASEVETTEPDSTEEDNSTKWTS